MQALCKGTKGTNPLFTVIMARILSLSSRDIAISCLDRRLKRLQHVFLRCASFFLPRHHLSRKAMCVCALRKKLFPDYFNFSLDCQLEILCARYIGIMHFWVKKCLWRYARLHPFINANVNIKIYKAFFPFSIFNEWNFNDKWSRCIFNKNLMKWFYTTNCMNYLNWE